MKLNNIQVKELIEYKSNSIVRGIGFLYLRYSCDPFYLWSWFNRYILDDEEITPSKDNNFIISVGEYIEKLLTELDHYGTRL